MSDFTEDALNEARQNLRDAGISLTEEGRVRTVAGHLDQIAQEGGGVIDQETAVDWAERVLVGEDTIIEVARDVTRFSEMLRTAGPSISTYAVEGFMGHLMDHLGTGVAGFLYGASTTALYNSLAPLAEAEAPKAAEVDE